MSPSCPGVKIFFCSVMSEVVSGASFFGHDFSWYVQNLRIAFFFFLIINEFYFKNIGGFWKVFQKYN